MLQQTSNTNIRIKRNFNIENSKLMKTGNSLGQSKYIEPFGKYFIDKNKERLNGFNNTTGVSYITAKESDRYLVNVTKLQRLNNSHTAVTNDRPTMINRTLSSCISNQQFPTAPLQKTSTSQSHRSNLLTVNIKHLPRLNNSTNGLNVSHNKIQILREDVEILVSQAIDLSSHTRDFSIIFGKTKHSIEQHTSEVQKNLKSKVNDLSKLVQQTVQNNKQRSFSLLSDCASLKDKNSQMKSFLQLIQQRIQNIQNSLGLITAHHKHFV